MLADSIAEAKDSARHPMGDDDSDDVSNKLNSRTVSFARC